MGLDAVELVMAFEGSFGVVIPDAVAEKMLTPADVIAFVESELRRRPDDPLRPLIAEIVRLHTIEQLGVKPKVYREDATFVGDFGAD
jgi:acyl carrier protein